MSDARLTDTALRLIETMKLVPVAPDAARTVEIVEQLAARGIVVTQRTVQRDLSALAESVNFPIVGEFSERPYLWSWSRLMTCPCCGQSRPVNPPGGVR